MKKAIELHVSGYAQRKETLEHMVIRLRENGARVHASNGQYLDDLQFSIVSSYSGLLVDIRNLSADIKAEAEQNINAFKVMTADSGIECGYCKQKSAHSGKVKIGAAVVCYSCKATDYSKEVKDKFKKQNRLEAVNKSRINLKVTQ